MKTIAICNEVFKKTTPENKYFNFTLNGENITVGILNNTEPTHHSIKIKDDKVLVKVNAFSCNYRDKAIMLYYNSLCQKSDREQKGYFNYFGSEFVAEVIQIGDKIKNLKIGDRVIPDGCYPYRRNGQLGGIPTNYASQRMHFFHENQLLKIPDSMSDEVAASFTIASQTGYGMIRRLKLKKDSVVLVTSATSNTSLAVIKMLINKGIKTYAISSNHLFEKQLLNLGIHQLIPYSALANSSINDYLKNIEFDAVIDPFFDIYFPQLINHMKYGSKYIFCGIYNQSPYFDQLKHSNFDIMKVISQGIMKNISVIGNCLGIKGDLQNALDDYTKGDYDITIDSIYEGDDIIQFLQKTFGETPRFGKVVYKYV